jgi:hypothetical protein
VAELATRDVCREFRLARCVKDRVQLQRHEAALPARVVREAQHRGAGGGEIEVEGVLGRPTAAGRREERCVLIGGAGVPGRGGAGRREQRNQRVDERDASDAPYFGTARRILESGVSSGGRPS